MTATQFLCLDLIKVEHPNGIVPERYTLLNKKSIGPKCELRIDNDRDVFQTVIVNFKYIQHSYTLQLTVRMIGDDGKYDPYKQVNEYRMIEEPLTIAYI